MLPNTTPHTVQASLWVLDHASGMSLVGCSRLATWMARAQVAMRTALKRMPAAAELTLLAQQTVRLLPALPQLLQRDATPCPGARFALLPGAAKRPALILLGGSEGGSLIKRNAPVYVSRGYAVLALPYYSPPPVEDIAAPVLVAGSHDDQVWDSGGMAQAIAQARDKADRFPRVFEFLTQALGPGPGP